MRRAMLVAGVGLLLLPAGGCRIEAEKAKVFITRDARIVANPPVRRAGEVIIEIENNDDARHRPLLLRLDDGRDLGSLPRGTDGTIEAGRPSDLEHDGDGYQVVEKLDTMRPYFGSGRRVKELIHTYLRPGTYAIVDNLPSGTSSDALVFSVGEEP